MQLFIDDNRYQEFIDKVDSIADSITPYTDEADVDGVRKLADNFRMKIDDFNRENRKLNIGVIGQVKAGKSSFLNTLLFDGREVLPKAATPKTATLTKMEYSEENSIEIEFYNTDEWETIEYDATVDADGDQFTSARELVEMVRKNGYNPEEYLSKGMQTIPFDSYNDLIIHLNDYVGEDGRYTPMVKSVVLHMNNDNFKGLSIVDTPGLNDPIVSRTVRTREFIEVCDVVFFLSQAGSFLDSSDWNLLSDQLPQKGVNRLVLVASKYDSALRDVLKEKKPVDTSRPARPSRHPRRQVDNNADNIPDAMRIVERKLQKRAKEKVDEYLEELTRRGASDNLIKVIQGCQEPVMVSSIACNMSHKDEADYSSEEKNIRFALEKFSDNIDDELAKIGNFDEVRSLFSSVVKEKQEILDNKSKEFIPNAETELKSLLTSYVEKTEKRVDLLSQNDRESLISQKKETERQINTIKADIEEVFGDLNIKIENEKSSCIRDIRNASKDHMNMKEHTGSEQKTGYRRERFLLIFHRNVSYQYTEHYSYFMAADAIENLQKFSVDASNDIDEIFSDVIKPKELRRQLTDVIVKDFDMSSEKYDSDLFRQVVQETVSSVSVPIMNIDLSKAMDELTGKFNGEVRSAEEKNQLYVALSKAVNTLYNEMVKKTEEAISKLKTDIIQMKDFLESRLLENISKEYDVLISQCEDKDREIARYENYVHTLKQDVERI